MNSDFSNSDIQKGMDVFDSTGNKIGSISDVYQDAGMGGTGTWDTTGSGTTGGVGDVIVEEIDIVSTPDYSSGTGTGIDNTGMGSTGTSGIGSTGTSNFDTTGTAGYGSGTDTSGMGTAGAYGSSTAGAGTMTSTGYFKISEGGVLGIGATDLYIPFSAISNVTGDGIYLNCTKDQAEQQYQQKPAFLQDQETNTF